MPANNDFNFNFYPRNIICQFNSYVKFANLIGNNGILVVSDDNYIKVWGDYDESLEQYKLLVCQSLLDKPSACEFYHPTYLLFVGLSNGLIAEYKLSNNLQSLTYTRNYNRHNAAILSIFYSALNQIILTGSQDKFVYWHSTASGLPLGSVLIHKMTTALGFDSATKLIFIGDQGGDIHMIKIEETYGYKPLSVLKEHTSAISQVLWDPLKLKLYSASEDGLIVIWDIGGKNGKIIQMFGHVQKVTKLILSNNANILLSSSLDGIIIAWNLTVDRKEPATWKDSDYCENCKKPFIWNIKSMIESKMIGVRQHHCRKCGSAFCHNCCSHVMRISESGYEIPVRVCKACFTGHNSLSCTEPAKIQSVANSSTGKAYNQHSKTTLNQQESIPSNQSTSQELSNIKWSVYFNVGFSVLSMDMCENKKIVLTSSSDKNLKTWNIESTYL